MKTKIPLLPLAAFLAVIGLTLLPTLRSQEPATDEPALREVTGTPATPPTPANDDEDVVAVVEETPAKSESTRPPRRQPSDGVVQFGSDVLLEAGREASELVAIMGDIIAEGHVRESAVAIMGNTTINGVVDDEAVAVLGNVTINGTANGDVVAVMGNVQVGPNAVVKGEIVSVGGRVIRAPGAQIDGPVQQVPFLGDKEIRFDGLREWVKRCLLLGRPLAFGPHLGWAWGLALSFFAVYLLLALIMGKAVNRCAETLERRPGMTFLTAVLTLLLTPVVFVLLAFTGIGPLLMIPLMFVAMLFGKAAFLTWLGRRITVPMGSKLPVLATLIGGLIVLGLYLVPFLGFAVQKGASFIGLGMVVLTIVQSMRRDPAPAGPATEVPPVPPAGMPSMPPPVAAPAPMSSAGFGVEAVPGLSAPPPPPLPMPAEPAAVPPPPVNPPPPATAARTEISAPFTTMPRAGFWVRVGALLLDAVLVGVVGNFLGLEDYFPAVFATYCVVLWTLRGTTLGGAVCNLKVVRLDDRPLDWGVALIRALGGFLSLVVIGLGFIWIAFDPERQAWHDKIAGTVVVRVPKGVSLI